MNADRSGWYYAYVLLGLAVGVALSLADWAGGFVRETWDLATIW